MRKSFVWLACATRVGPPAALANNLPNRSASLPALSACRCTSTGRSFPHFAMARPMSYHANREETAREHGTQGFLMLAAVDTDRSSGLISVEKKSEARRSRPSLAQNSCLNHSIRLKKRCRSVLRIANRGLRYNARHAESENSIGLRWSDASRLFATRFRLEYNEMRAPVPCSPESRASFGEPKGGLFLRSGP